MLNDRNDNRFLNVLSDIDDDLIDEITETPIEPEIIHPAPKKSPFIRFAPVAASLAVMAVLGIGVMLLMQNLPFSTSGGEGTGGSEITAAEVSTQGTDNSSQQNTTPAETTDPEYTLYEFPGADEILSQEIWKDINHYHKIDANDEESLKRIPNYSINAEDAKYQSGLLVGSLFDIKDCGNYKVALLGFNVWKDTYNIGDNTVLASELRIALVQDDKIISTLPIQDRIESADPTVFTLMLDHLNGYTEAVDFEQDEYIIIFRFLQIDTPVPEALFYSISNGNLLSGKMISSESVVNTIGLNLSYTLSPAISTGVTDNGNYMIYDNLTGVTYGFEPLDVTHDGYSYYHVSKRQYPWNEDGEGGYFKFDPDSIPVIDEFTYDEVNEIIDKLTPKTVISEQKVGDYTLSLMGENMWKNSEGTIYFYNPQTVISKNGEYIGRVDTTFPEMYKYRASMMYSNTGSYDHYAVNAYMFGDTLLVIDHGMLNDSLLNYFGSDCFFAYNDTIDHMARLSGYWPGMNIDEPPAWTVGKQGQELTVDTENQTVIYGFQKYTFDLSVIPVMYNYTVTWIDEPIE